MRNLPVVNSFIKGFGVNGFDRSKIGFSQEGNIGGGVGVTIDGNVAEIFFYYNFNSK